MIKFDIPDGERYRPSNGTEGMCFQEIFCDQCDKSHYEGKTDCKILMKTLLYDVDDINYPTQWVYVDGYPNCLSFKSRKEMNKWRRESRKQVETKGQLTLFGGKQ